MKAVALLLAFAGMVGCAQLPPPVAPANAAANAMVVVRGLNSFRREYRQH